MELTDNLIFKVLQASIKAGNAIMDIYSQPFDVELKEDLSPLTIADKTSHEIIQKELSETGIPILSEEGTMYGFEIRKDWNQFWMIDPLDGTKEFVHKNGDFTVNIALIKEQQSIFGVVFAPVPGFLYWGSTSGSYRIDTTKQETLKIRNLEQILAFAEKLPCITDRKAYHVLGSRSHMNTETESFINDLKMEHPGLLFVSRGSSLKFCALAEGGADIYPRFSPTMEWDTAAGHAVAKYAGCNVFQIENGLPLVYNKPSLLNPNFIASRNA